MSMPNIHVHTAPTMNVWKSLIFREEAGVEHELVGSDFPRGE